MTQMLAAVEQVTKAGRSSSYMLGVSLAILALLLVVILMFVVLIILRFVMSRRERDFEEKKESLRPLVFRLITGDEPPDEIVATLRSAVPDRFRDALEHVLLENARALKGHESDLLAYAYENLGFMREDVEQLERGKVVKRCESAFHLGTMRVPGAVPTLVGVLSSDSAELRFTALNALSKIGTDDALDAVMEHLAADPDIRTLRVAEVILERKQAFLPALEGMVAAGGGDPERLGFVLDLLGVTRDARAVPSLSTYLTRSETALRSKAARALGLIGDPEACDPLLPALEDPAADVRMEAARALGRLQCAQAIPGLALGLSDPALSVKMNSALALMELGDDGQAALEEALRTSMGDVDVAYEVLDIEKVKRGEEEREGL